MKVDKEGVAVLGDGRPSEDTFKIHGGKNKCDHCYYHCSILGPLRAHSKCKTADKCNRCGYECYNPSVLRRRLSLFLRNKEINATSVSITAPIIVI